jgi:hypothetical protein
MDLALKLDEILAEKGRENQRLAAARTNEFRWGTNESLSQNSDKAINTSDRWKVIAKKADVSHDTLAKWKKIKKSVIPEIVEKVRKEEISYNEAYKVANMDTATQQAIAAKMDYQQSVRAAQPFRI